MLIFRPFLHRLETADLKPPSDSSTRIKPRSALPKPETGRRSAGCKTASIASPLASNSARKTPGRQPLASGGVSKRPARSTKTVLRAPSATSPRSFRKMTIED
jgi:hypothetical protein